MLKKSINKDIKTYCSKMEFNIKSRKNWNLSLFLIFLLTSLSFLFYTTPTSFAQSDEYAMTLRSWVLMPYDTHYAYHTTFDDSYRIKLNQDETKFTLKVQRYSSSGSQIYVGSVYIYNKPWLENTSFEYLLSDINNSFHSTCQVFGCILSFDLEKNFTTSEHERHDIGSNNYQDMRYAKIAIAKTFLVPKVDFEYDISQFYSDDWLIFFVYVYNSTEGKYKRIKWAYKTSCCGASPRIFFEDDNSTIYFKKNNLYFILIYVFDKEQLPFEFSWGSRSFTDDEIYYIGTEPRIDKEFVCNDAVDNDLDGYTDMEDADCIEWAIDQGFQVLSERGTGDMSYDDFEITGTAMDPSAGGLKDAVCGDDPEDNLDTVGPYICFQRNGAWYVGDAEEYLGGILNVGTPNFYASNSENWTQCNQNYLGRTLSTPSFGPGHGCPEVPGYDIYQSSDNWVNCLYNDSSGITYTLCDCANESNQPEPSTPFCNALRDAIHGYYIYLPLICSNEQGPGSMFDFGQGQSGSILIPFDPCQGLNVVDCLIYSQEQSCEDMDGTVCNSTQVCTGTPYMQPNGEMCCMDGTCEDIENVQCGDIGTYICDQSVEYCPAGFEMEDQNGQECCRVPCLYRATIEDVFSSVICYAKERNQLLYPFAQCGEGNIFSTFNIRSLGSDNELDNTLTLTLNLFGRGSSTQSIATFDTFKEDIGLVNYIDKIMLNPKGQQGDYVNIMIRIR